MKQLRILASGLFLALSLLAAQPAWAALLIDGGATATSSTQAIPVALVTTNSNDVLVAYIKLGTNDGTVTAVSDNGPHLTWARRSSIAFGATQTLEEWYAISPSPFNATITAATSLNGGIPSRIIAYGISGADTTTPFDTNGSVPQTNQVTSSTTLAPASAYSTSNANDALIIGMGATGGIVEPAGFSAATASGSTTMDVSYKIVSATQSSISPTYTQTSGIGVGIWDAVRQAPAGMSAGAASVTSVGSTIATVAVANASGGTSPYTYQWYRSTTSGFTPGGGTILSGATSQTLNDTGLTNGTTYYYVNVATDSASATASSNQISVTPVASLTAGTATTVSAGSTIASVTVASATGGTSPYSYQWYRSTTTGFTPGGGNIVAGATSQTLNDTGLTNGTTYFYKNVVTDAASATSVSNQTSATPGCAAVALGTAALNSAGSTVASVTSPAATGGCTTVTYQWYRSTDPAALGSAVSGATSLTLNDTGLTNGTPYYYTVKATDGTTTATGNQVAALPAKTVYVGLIGDSYLTTTCASGCTTASVTTSAAGNILQQKLEALYTDGTAVFVNNQGIGGTNGNDWAPLGTDLTNALAAFASSHSTHADWTVMVHLGGNDSSVTGSVPTGGESVAQYQAYMTAIANYLINTWGAGNVIFMGPPYLAPLSANHTVTGVKLLSQYQGALQTVAAGFSGHVYAPLLEYNYILSHQTGVGGDHVHPIPADSNGQGATTNISTMWAHSIFSILNPTPVWQHF